MKRRWLDLGPETQGELWARWAIIFPSRCFSTQALYAGNYQANVNGGGAR